MTSSLRRNAALAVKALSHAIGFDVIRLKNVPRLSLAGLAGQPFGTVIDCGANEGQFARSVTRLFPNATLYCFEPLDEPFERLSTWAATQGGRVRCFRTALGSHEGASAMNYHVEHSTSSSILATTAHERQLFPETVPQRTVTVPITTLDIAVNDVMDSFDRKILLKLDVQGYEDRVLSGATKFLQQVDACLLEVSVDPLYKTQAEFKDLVDLLSQAGLKYAGNIDQSYAEDGRIMWLDALFLRRASLDR